MQGVEVRRFVDGTIETIAYRREVRSGKRRTKEAATRIEIHVRADRTRTKEKGEGE